MTNLAITTLKETVAFLGQPGAYPGDAAAVVALETHMSWIFLAGGLAVKLKKPVRNDFLDYRSLESRRQGCEDALRLNGRLAPDVYLDAVPLAREPTGALAIGGAGKPVDWLLRMHRLPSDRMLDRAIRAGAVKTRELRMIARLLARFFSESVPVAMPPAEYRRRVADSVTRFRRTLAVPEWDLSGRAVERVTAALRRTLMGNAPLFDGRVRRGRIREGHGDLRAEHVFLGPKAAVIDCLEFNPDFRIQDSADELCLLAVECEMLGSPGAGKVVLESCLARLGDDVPPELIAFYKTFRAMMRAALSILHLADDDPREPAHWRERAESYLALAEHHALQLG